jgi:membrane associated rhomboid family serine protease
LSFGRGNQTSFGPPVTPQVIKSLLIANGLVFVAYSLTGGLGGVVGQLGTVSPVTVWMHFELWRPFTYMWLHAGVMHLAFNMLALWMFGSQLALAWGEQRFLKYYLTCGVGAGLLIASVPMVPAIAGWPMAMNLNIPTLGASGAVMGVLLAFSFTWPDRVIHLIFPPIPLKSIWLIPLLLFFELFGGPANVSHLGHLGGVVVGWIYLVQEGKTPGAPTAKNLKLRYQRHTMRKKLRSVHDEARRERDKQHNDKTYH